jgi:hypothetical protein
MTTASHGSAELPRAGGRPTPHAAPGSNTAHRPVIGPRGTYKLYCSLLGGLHDQWGMHASLTVQ